MDLVQPIHPDGGLVALGDPGIAPGIPDSKIRGFRLGFAIPYFNNGQDHDYMPDFIIRLRDANKTNLILETKGYDPLEETKVSAARRWVDAVNAEGTYGRWAFRLAKKPTEVLGLISATAE